MEQNSDSPSPSAIKIIISGSAIGLGAILLFGLIWFGLGQSQVPTSVRLVAAVCVPPAIMTGITLWLYFTRGRQI